MPVSAAAAEIEQHRAYLMRYASLQLRDAGAAEDAVQDTLMAALEGWDRFSAQSSVKTWLTGILKHKIIDHIRRQSREQPLISGDGENGGDEADAIALAAFRRRDVVVSRKPDRTFVTDVDQVIEQLLRERVWAAFPGHGLVGEEYGVEDGAADVRGQAGTVAGDVEAGAERDHGRIHGADAMADLGARRGLRGDGGG